MRKIVAIEFISLDGVIQAPGGPGEDRSNGFQFGGWIVKHNDEKIDSYLGETYNGTYDLLLGRKTYDIFNSYWPRMAESKTAHPGEVEMGKKFNKVTKYVATHNPKDLPWINSQPLGKDLVASLIELKKETGPTLLIIGSSNLMQTFLSYDLVDELRLMIYPVVLGKGKRLFSESAIPAGFKVTSSLIGDSGVIAANYERNGPVEVGSFDLP